ncbi:MAG: FISUMP domain-containing protein [Lentimicrobium sp.]
MSFASWSNVNAALPGILIVNNAVTSTLNKIIIVWSNVNPATLSNGAKLLDLNFTYLSGDATLTFNNTSNGGGDCEYADENGDPMNDDPTTSFFLNAQITNIAVGPIGSISGPSAVSQGQSGVEYNVPPVANATGYVWSLPSGATISGGNNTNTVLVDFSESAISGEIIVQASNSCGNGEFSVPFPVTVNSNPVINVTPISLNFGNVLAGTHSEIQTYSITGHNLTAPVIVSAPDGFTIQDANWQFVQTKELPYTDGNLNATITVRFKPASATAYLGNITNESTGAITQNVSVTGTGIQNNNPYIIVEPEALYINFDYLDPSTPPCTPSQTYRIYGNNLTGPLLIDLEAQGFEFFSLTGGDDFTESLTLIPLNGNVDTTVYVRLCPFDANGYAIISNSSSGISQSVLHMAIPITGNAPITTISHVTAKPGTVVYVPVTVTDFIHIRQAQYSIQFDPNVLTFQDLIYQMITNCWPDTSVIQINENLSQLNILLDCATDVNITMPDNSKLFDLVFSYSSGTSSLTFGDCSSINYWTGALIDEPDSLYYHNGSVSLFQKTINLELNLEGLFNPSQGDMNQAYGRNFPDTIADEITIGIANSTFPYAIQFELDSVFLERTGQCQIEVPCIFNGEYYIVIRHRNSIETWSKYPVPFNTDTISYNFTDLISKAYHNNLILKGISYCIYAADINQDGVVDTGDMSIADNESSQFITGYNPSDINGDGNTNVGDMVIVDNNSSSYTTVQRPFSSFPVVITSDVSNITNSTARCGGEIIEQGSSSVSISGVCWSTEPNPTTADYFSSDGQGTGSFVSMITDLWPNTTYYVRAFATNNTETVYGNQVSFSTSIYFSGSGVTDIDNNVYNSIILGTQEWMSENLRVTHYRNGEIIPNITDNTWNNLTSGAYCWYENDEVAYKNNYGALYNFYPVVDNRYLCPVGWHVPSEEDWNTLRDFLGGEDIAGGKMKSTRTAPEPQPRWDSPNVGATNESGFSGIPGGYRLPNGIFEENGRSGYWWNATADGSNNVWMRALDLNGDNLYMDVASRQFGFSVRCLRGIDISTLTTTPIYDITGITAAGGGNITSDGGAPVTQRGVCWSISPNPTIADNHSNDGSGTGPFISNLTGLIPNTLYFVRAYATNSAGTSYGNQLTFASIPNLPIIVTNDVTSITQISALSGGNITSDAGNAVFFRGVCWSFSSEPTISDDHTTDGNGMGNFVSNLTGLTTNTLYYLRAYAVNSNGTAYGNEISFFTLPNVTTTPVSGITQTTAGSGGEITFGGGATITERGVCWSTIQNPTTADNHTSDGTGTGIYTSYLTGLTGNTVYYVRAYATNGSGTSYGSQFNFITAPLLPDVTTNPVINITMTSAKSGGNITSNGGANVTERGVCWSTTTGPTISDSHTSNGTGIGTFVSNLTGLAPNTLYYARAYATNSAGTAYGNEITFTTLSYLILPTITTTEVTNVLSNTATTGGNVISDGGGAVTFRGVCWSTSPNPVISGNHTTDGSGTGEFTSNLTGLTPGTLYYVRAYAVNSVGIVYGNEFSFTTGNCIISPFVRSHIAGSVAPVDKTVTYNVVDSYLSGSYKCWITQNLGADHQAVSATDATEASAGWYWQFNKKQGYKHNGTYLTPNTTWIFPISENSNWASYNDPCTLLLGTGWRIPTKSEWQTADEIGGWDNYTEAYASVLKLHAAGKLYEAWGGLVGRGSEGYYWSNEQQNSQQGWFINFDSGYCGIDYYLYKESGFSLRCLTDGTSNGSTLPTVSTAEITNINSNSAISGGNVTNDGGETVTARGVCWSTSQSPTLTDNHTTDGQGLGSFISNITGLSHLTTYYVRAYAINCVGTAYGNEVTFNSLDILPSITTSQISDITTNSAVSGGEVTYEGASAVTARGVCWSTSPNPTLADSYSIDGSGIGTFISTIPWLNPSTIYYARAYATNISGTSYGNEESFKTKLFTQGSGVIDFDNNTYNSVILGNQEWMSENLKVTHYLNGDNIPNVPDFTWYILTSGAYCWYDNDEATYKNSYGALYNWYTIVDDRNLCPSGWHIPNFEDWTTLTSFLGGADTAGGKMKSTSTAPDPHPRWDSPNVGATNESGFSGIPGGYRLQNGGFEEIGRSGYWWNDTIDGSDNVWMRALDYNGDELYENSAVRQVGFSIRCLRGVNIPTLTTSPISDITGISAVSGGNIFSDGGAPVTLRGVCWSTSPNPTITDSHTFDGSGTGSFLSNLTGLNLFTTYYVRAHATNVSGTAYGNQVSFTTLETELPCINFTLTHTAGIVAPVDKTVTYGVTFTNLSGSNKCWITQNLGADHQADSATDATEASAGWYWQFNRQQGYKHDGTTRIPNSWDDVYEASNWLSSNDPCTLLLGGGWRIPTHTEWQNADATGGWNNYNDTYASVLKLHTAGYIGGSSLFSRGSNGFYWSKSYYSWVIMGHWYYTGESLEFGDSYSYIYDQVQSIGYSLRCIMD